MSINDIVISGMSGRFPMSSNVDEFAKNLYDGIDMVTTSEDRWPDGILGFTNRMGRIPDIDYFDGDYFGIMGQLVDVLDPMAKIVLETTYEAIIDAGISPQSMRGSRTGVYIGISKYSMLEGYPDDIQPDVYTNQTMLSVTGNIQPLYANRISYIFDFKGPSLVTDTACCSSLTAFNIAVNDLKLGHIDYAIVGGTHMTLQPFILQMKQEVSVCSPRGISAVLDESADGFVKADAIACVLLQRKPSAKRIYAHVLASRMNTDGKKTVGMFYPSTEAQESLMVMAYEEAGIDPLKMTYFEAHCTGTKVGDPQEVKAIYNAYCALPDRKGPLPLGLLKSNIGHTEGASGISSLIKVMIAYENESIPPNINLKTIKKECKKYCPPLYPNTEVLKYEPGMAGVNNFGIGGVNVNVLVEPNYKLAGEDNLLIAETIPRIVNICGRTEEAVKNIFDFIENNPEKISRDFLALLTDTMKQTPNVNSAGLPFRGSMIIKKSTDVQSVNKYEFKKQLSEVKSKKIKPIWFLFPGLGGQWPAMAKALMPIKVFADKIEECHQILAEFGVNLKHLLLSDDKKTISTMTAKFCATTSIELALFEVLKSLDIIPDGIIGHSFGEIACAYADGCLTTKQAMVITYFRGVVTESDKNIPKGLMAVCGLSKVEAMKLIPPEIGIACYNGKNTVVLSGPYNPMKQLIDDLDQKKIFVHQLESSDIPYHSKYLKSSAKTMTDMIKKYVPKPIKRSEKWISTSVLDPEVSAEELKYASAEYFVNNLINPVYFYQKFKELPADAVVIEIGPHSVFRLIVKETLDTASYLSLMKKDSNETNLDKFLTAIATLYELGLNPSIENLYPKVEFPVSRGTASISSLMKWDHSVLYDRKKYPEHYNKSTSADTNVTVDMTKFGDSYYSGHTVDGNMIFPAVGYLMLAWRQFSATLGKTWEEVPVVFEHIQFRRPVFLSDTDKVKIKVRYEQNTGEFQILEKDNLCCVGTVRSPTDDALLLQHIIYQKQNCILENEFCLETEDIYKELGCMGYDYTGEFRRLKKVRTNDFKEFMGVIEWDGKVVTFLDALLHSRALCAPNRKLMVPIMIKRVTIDPKVLMSAAKQYKLVDTEAPENLLKAADISAAESASADVQAKEELLYSYDNLQTRRTARYCVFKSDIPFYYDLESNMLLTLGIEVEDVISFPIPRRLETSNLVLDSYQFIANDDSNAIEEYYHKNIVDYIEICKSMAATLKQMGIKELNCDFNYKTLSEQLLEKYRHMNDGRHVVFKILDKIYKSINDDTISANLTPDQIYSIFSEYDLGKDMVNVVSKNERLIRTMIDIVSENNVPKREVKVTEINLTPDLLVKEVDKNMSNFQIAPTVVDYKLVVKSMDGISDTFADNSIVWKSIEELSLQTSDLIIFRDSYDFWSLNVKDLIEKFTEFVNSNGFLLIVNKYRFTESEQTLNAIQNGNKVYTNIDLEKRYTDILKSAEELGLLNICKKSDTIGNSALLFRKVGQQIEIPDKDRMIEITADGNENWFQSIKDKMIFARENHNDDTFWIVSRNKNITGLIGLMNCLRLEPGGENLRAIVDFDSKQPIDWNSQPFSDILKKYLTINVIKDGKLGTYRHLKLPEDADKVISNEYFLNLGQSRDLSSLSWFDLSTIKAGKQAYDISGHQITQVPISIYSSGLTFHDVMVATGRIPSGPQLLFVDCLIGSEFSGRRNDTGKRVMGFETTRCFATAINANVDLITDIPEHWSMDDAVTVLTTYSTAWYGLIERANLKKGQSILIHSGAGGVGQSAINICKHYNCDIYVTVGTEEKKRFLMNEYNIPENRIFSSRDIQFKYKIKVLTKGVGVDIVLNSLTGDKLDASCECLADGGRFVELGKFDLIQNKKLGMFLFLRDISFIGVAVDVSLIKDRDFAIRFFDWMHKNCNNGCVKPLNKTVFNANEAEKAFRYMTTGKHIGKIVLKIRDEEPIKGPLKTIKPAKEMLCSRKTYFNPNKVYIITGGLGGFGLELVHWMAYMGAKKFVLTSRYGLRTEYQKYIVNQSRILGEVYKFFKLDITVSPNDCLTIESAKHVISEASLMGQIGGIFHLSLVLNDCLFQDMSYDSFRETVDTKYKVFNNLDVVSRKLDYNLDYFVVFSSVACGKGNGGQSNYGFGNSLCERICEQRRSDGLHGLAVQFGPIGDVGVFTDMDQMLELSTLHKQRINSCCDVLEKVLSIKQPVVTSFVRSERTSEGGNRKGRMIKELWKALGIDPDTTPEHLTLGEIGIESMFAVELQQQMEREYNIKIALNHIKLITIKMLKDYERGNVGDTRTLIKKIKDAKQALSQYKFIMPKETHIRLNNVETGKPIYFMPPFEITFSSYEELAKKFNRPVIGLNWTNDMNSLKTMKDIQRYYLDLLKTLEPNGKYDLVGYFDGALVISKLLLKGLVNKAVIIDIIADKTITEKEITEDFILKFIMGFFTEELPESFKNKIFREVGSEPDLDSKIRRIVTELKEMVGQSLITTDMEESLHIAVKRLKIMSTYLMKKKRKYLDQINIIIAKKWAKKTGKLKFIKPFKYDRVDDVDEQIDTVRDLYYLPENEESKEFLTIEGIDFANPFEITSELIGNKILEEFQQ